MDINLLDIDLSRWGLILLYLLPALVNLGLFMYSVVYLTRSRVNWTFALLVLLLSFSQFSDGMLHLSNNEQTAEAWQRVALAPWLFIAPMGILFVLAFGKYSYLVRRSWLYAILFVPAIVLEFGVIAHLSDYNFLYTEGIGWIANPTRSIFNIIVFLFVTAGGLLMPVLFWTYWLDKKKSSVERKKFLLLAIGVTIPYVGGVVSEVIMPLLLNVNQVPLLAPLMTSFSVCALIAIRKYHMLDYSPRNQWDRILESMHEGILIADNNRKIMYANPALCILLDYNLDELVGKEADALILNNSLHGSVFNSDREFQMATRTGEMIWVVTNLAPCLDHNGKRIGTIWTITDIDDLKNKTISIRRSEKRLNRAQEVAHVGHWDLDFSTGVSIWSPEACRIYGLNPNEQVQSFERWISLVHPEDLPQVMMEIQRAHELYTDSDFEHRILLPDGTVKFLRSISKFEFNGTSTKPVGLYGVCQDITEIKQATEQLKVTTLELETYIYKSSHDLHAPLSTILGLINVGRREITDPTAKKYLEMIEGQAKKLESIRTDFIKAMLIKDAAKFDEQIHLQKMIPEIIESLRGSHGFERVHFNLRIPDHQPLVSNSYLVKTILHNLIENSVKYQDYNQLLSKLEIAVEQQEKGAIITVADNGIGIASEYQDRIFDMYFRGTEAVPGSGLGLYLVKKAVDKLNGKMHLRSNPGEGTTFTIMLAQAS